MHKNTLYITFDGLSDPLGQSQILPYVCGIAQKGYTITILSCEKKTRLEAEFDSIQHSIKHLPIQWQYILYDENGGMLSRLFYILKIRSLASRLIRTKNISLIHCRSYLASLIGLRHSRKQKIPFIFDMRGFWADERIDGGIWKKNKPLHVLFYTFFKRKEKQFLSESKAIVSLTHAGLSALEEHYPALGISKKTTVIPCCTNTSLFKPTNTETTLNIQGIKEHDHVIIYTGSIGTWYYTREIIDCALVWKEKIPDLKLLFLTKDQEELDQVLSAYSHEQKNIIVSASCSYKDVPKYLTRASAAIFFIKPAYSKIASSPTKMAECWAMNLPIITNSGIGDNDLFFNDHKGGVLVKAFTRNDYLSCLEEYLSLMNDPSSYRNIALNFFDTAMAIKKYCDIYDTLCNKNSLGKE